MDANLLHISYEGNSLENPWQEFDPLMLKRTQLMQNASNDIEEITIDFENGDPTAINGEILSPANLLTKLNLIGGKHGVGVIDIVENRFVGIKSRGVYETPGGTILLHAHRAIESITLDREAMHLKDELMPKYSKILYNGFWFSPERQMLQAAIDKSQERVTGTVKLKLYKGSVYIAGRKSPNSLYNADLASFEESDYNQKDAEGFIKLNAIRLMQK